MSSYFAIEKELQSRRTQADSVRGKKTPYRIEFRYPRGTKHYQYFTCIEDTKTAKDSQCRYNIYGDGLIISPTSQEIQVQGRLGGWSKYKKEKTK